MRASSDVIVSGTGPVGLVASLSLARAGFSVTLVGPPVNIGDCRTTALMAPSLAFLDGLGIGETLEAGSARFGSCASSTRRAVSSAAPR